MSTVSGIILTTSLLRQPSSGIYILFRTEKPPHCHIVTQCGGINLSKQVQHTVKIDFFSDMYLVFWSGHVIEQKFQNQSASEPAAFDFEIGKAHRKVRILNVLDADEARIFHGAGKAVAIFCVRRFAMVLRGGFSEIFPTDGLVAGTPVLAAKPAAFVAEKLDLVLQRLRQRI